MIKKSFLKIAAMSALAFMLTACENSESITTGDYKSASETQIEKPENAVGYFSDIVYGSKDAKIEIIEYASMTCPHCATFDKTVLPTLKEKYIDTGKVKLIYRNFVMNQPDLQATVFLRCKDETFAKKVKKLLFDRQNVWLAGDPTQGLASEARRLGVPRTQLDKCLANKDMQRFLVEMKNKSMSDYAVNATPTLIVDGGKVEAPTLENMEKAIEAALK